MTTLQTGTDAINLTGNNLAQTIDGNAGVNVLSGLAGNDFLRGLGGNDTLFGGNGNDRLDGGAGVDVMTGGSGNDRYFVNVAGDTVVETAGEGTADIVLASVSYTLAAGVDIELLSTTLSTGVTAINLTGNELAQLITGNDGSNVLIGGGGADTLSGRAGNDTLDGGTGIDRLFGGDGNDWFYVDDAGDVIVESALGGTDRVLASVSYALGLGADVEFLETTLESGTGAINLTGNNFAQTITGNDGVNILNGLDGHDILIGNAGADTLFGGTGADTMIGGADNDVYIVDNAADIIVETAGEGTADRVLASVSYALAADDDIEVLRVLNGAGVDAINLTGNALAQRIIGNAGDNVLNGMGGNDTLSGELGADTFVFNTALGAGNVDNITDFSVVDDTIWLSASVFSGLTSGMTLEAAAFAANATGQATDALQRIIYETGSGKIWFDADGVGGTGRILFGDLAGGLAVTNADFFVII